MKKSREMAELIEEAWERQIKFTLRVVDEEPSFPPPKKLPAPEKCPYGRGGEPQRCPGWHKRLCKECQNSE